ncbi:MAG: hypothetical protein V4443_10360 [Pseudomonadota bacterium]
MVPDDDSGKPDHALAELEAARNLLAQLSDDEPLDALREIAAWLGTMRDSVSFRPERRVAIVMLVDETAQLLLAKLQQQYLDLAGPGELAGGYRAGSDAQAQQRMQVWQGIYDFMAVLAHAYAACIDAYVQPGKKPLNFKSHMPLLLVRLLRASAAQMKLSLMRYQEVEPAVWERLYRHYQLARTHLLANNMVMAYATDAMHISPQKELLRTLVVYVSSPASLTPAQIETSYQISFQLVNFFELREASDPNCAYLIDLVLAGPPQRVLSDLHVNEHTRFFGAVKAVAKVQELIDKLGNEAGAINKQLPPALSVLRHLHAHWSKEPPRRQRERRDIATDITVVHGFNAISGFVAEAEASLLPAAARHNQPKPGRAALPLGRPHTHTRAEIWDVLDVSTMGVGGVLPDPSDASVKVGTLCGIKAKSCNVWWAGIVRRRQADRNGQTRIGIEILAKHPAVVLLRQVQRQQPRMHRIFGRFPEPAAAAVLPGILLADVKKSCTSLLLEAGKFVMDQNYEVTMGGQSGALLLTGLLVDGDDYQQVSFQWLVAAS